MWNRRDTLRLLGGAACTPFLGRAQMPTPNFVILLADDLGFADVGFNGRREWDTPNIDRLALQGTTFQRWYSASPLCAPSRACLLTGKYTIHNGVKNNNADLPRTEVTVAKALKQHGYTTAMLGKWHRGRLPDGSFTHPLDHGFDSTFGYLDARAAWEHFPQTLSRGRDE